MSVFSSDTPPAIVADNDRIARAELGRSLQRLGLRVTVCAHLKEMFAALKPLKEALVFIDLHIDDTDCLSLLPRIISKAGQVGRRYLFIAMSDFGGANIALSVMKAGAFRYLKKPVPAAILESSVSDAVAELRSPGGKATVERFVSEAAPGGDEARSSGVGAVPGEPSAAADVPPAADEGTRGSGRDEDGRDRVSPENSRGTQAGRTFSPAGDGTGTDGPGCGSETALSDSDRGEPDDIIGGRVYMLDRMTVLRVAPEEPGVITLFDTNKAPLYVEWASNLNQRLCFYVDLHPASSEIARTARYFEIVPTMDRNEESKVFDRIVNKTGSFPSLMDKAPQGSRHTTSGSLAGDGDDGRITGYERTTDPALIEKIRKIMAENPTEPLVQEWLAFTLYSNNMLDEAIEWYTRLITGGSRKEEHFFYCANAFYKRGDKDRAVKMWKVAMSLNPGSTIARKSASRIDSTLSGADPEMTMF